MSDMTEHMAPDISYEWNPATCDFCGWLLSFDVFSGFIYVVGHITASGFSISHCNIRDEISGLPWWSST